MKFDFVKSKCSDLGLVVKHGNSDNVVFFFDENEDAACYKLRLFRTNLICPNESFIVEDSYAPGDEIEIYQSSWNKIENVRIKNHASNVCFNNKELFVQKSIKSVSGSFRVNGKDIGFRSSGYTYSIVEVESFSNVKFITTLEADRNSLYFNISFLPCGQYLAILDIENRNCDVFKTSIPYYFVIKAKSDKIKYSEDNEAKALDYYFQLISTYKTLVKEKDLTKITAKEFLDSIEKLSSN